MEPIGLAVCDEQIDDIICTKRDIELLGDVLTFHNMNGSLVMVGEAIGVVGAGALGVQISAHLLYNGFNVVLKTRSPSNFDIIKFRVEKLLTKYLPTKEGLLSNLKLVSDYRDLHDCAVIIEAVSEDQDVKVEVLKEVEWAVTERTFIFTNSSSISIDFLANKMSYPDRFLGFHLFNPVLRMGLVEIVVGALTSNEAVQKALGLAKGLGKDPVTVKSSPGFIVNRLLLWQINEATRMVTEGVSTIEDIDKAVRLGLNHPLGPFQLADLIGLDVCISILSTLEKDLGIPGYSPSPLLRQMVGDGHLGKKSGRGFYHYAHTVH